MNDNRLEDVSKLNDENKRCIICMEDFQNNDTVTYLPCIHFFHKQCIKQWFNNRSECPICKLKI